MNFTYEAVSSGRGFLSLHAAILGTFGITAYYSDLAKPLMPIWLVVALFTTPIALVLVVQWGEASDRLVARVHMFAACMFLLYAIGIEIGAYFGYRPHGLALYRLFVHLGWSLAWADIFRTAYARSRSQAQRESVALNEATSCQSDA